LWLSNPDFTSRSLAADHGTGHGDPVRSAISAMFLRDQQPVPAYASEGSIAFCDEKVRNIDLSGVQELVMDWRTTPLERPCNNALVECQGFLRDGSRVEQAWRTSIDGFHGCRRAKALGREICSSAPMMQSDMI
jgi:hypothetical protein